MLSCNFKFDNTGEFALILELKNHKMGPAERKFASEYHVLCTARTRPTELAANELTANEKRIVIFGYKCIKL